MLVTFSIVNDNGYGGDSAVSDHDIQHRPSIQIEVRPEKKDTPSFKMLVEALLSAAREELAWEAEAQARAGEES
jgi:hypothetical protein